MKKNRINAFTLVEMLIVIVIIGILIAALMPRMQAAQWRARDVSRKTALSQVQSAIVTSQWDKWKWPGQDDDDSCTDCWQVWTWLSMIEDELKRAWMNSIPVDPLKTDDLKWLWDFVGDSDWNYAYMVTTRNWTPNWWFVLMAKTEVEWSSNWVVCDGKSADSDSFDKYWRIKKGTDIVDIHPCTKFEKNETTNTLCEIKGDGTCVYDSDGELRYIVLY